MGEKQNQQRRTDAADQYENKSYENKSAQNKSAQNKSAQNKSAQNKSAGPIGLVESEIASAPVVQTAEDQVSAVQSDAPEPRTDAGTASRAHASGKQESDEQEPDEQWPAIVRSLRNPDFRLFWSGNFLSNIGTWMQNIAQGWLVLQLSNSSFWLGMVGFAASLPFLIFTLFGGVVADRVNKRYLLLTTQSIMMVLAFTMAALTHWNIITIASLAALAFANGVAQSLNAPSYQAMVPQLVRRSDLNNAIALNSAQFHLSRVLGPTLGGFAMAAFGIAGNFFLNGLSFLAVIFAIFRMRYVRETPTRKETMWSSLRAGLRYVHADKSMWAMVVLALIISIFVMPFVTFIPWFAKNALHTSASGLGLLMACSGLGAFIGALVMAHSGKQRNRGRWIVIDGLVAMAGLIVFCYSTNFAISAVCMGVEGFFIISMIAPINVIMQELSSDEMRGRVMSVNATAFMGFPPVGNLLAGELSRHMPLAHAIAGMIATAMACFLGYLFFSKPLRALD